MAFVCTLDAALLLTDVSELFELSTLALLGYTGQLLNQLERNKERVITNAESKHKTGWSQMENIWFGDFSFIFNQAKLHLFLVIAKQQSGKTTQSKLRLLTSAWKNLSDTSAVLTAQVYRSRRHSFFHTIRQNMSTGSKLMPVIFYRGLTWTL